MEMLWKCMALVLLLSLSGCAATYDLESPEKVFTKVEHSPKLIMREVDITINEDGNIVFTPESYENLSKNLSDIYTKIKLQKETIRFYESQMFDKED